MTSSLQEVLCTKNLCFQNRMILKTVLNQLVMGIICEGLGGYADLCSTLNEVH